MSTKRGLLDGWKIKAKGHTTVIDDAVQIIEAAKSCPHVEKIVISMIYPYGAPKKRLKFKKIQAGLKVTVRGTNAQQVLYVYTHKPDQTKSALKSAWT